MAELMKVRVMLPHGSDPSRGPGWTDLWVREDTPDEDVVQEVWILDVYHLRGLDMTRKSLNVDPPRIIDIGACTGIFAACCLQMYPDVTVEGYEPGAENWELAGRNVAKFPKRASIDHAAVGAYRGHVEMVGEGATGHTIRADHGVRQVTLEEAVGGRQCRLLKVDCEGAEYAIIDAAPVATMELVDLIHMEWHGPEMAPWVQAGNPQYGDMLQKLAYTHAVTVFGHPHRGGMLYAHRYD